MSSESLPSTVFENFDEHLAFSIPPASPSSCTLAQDSLAISEVAAGEETDQGTLAERPPSFNSIVDPEGVLRHALASELFETQWTAPTDLETDSSTIAADISLNDFGWTGQSSTSQEYRDELVGDRSARCERSFRPSVTIPSCQYPGEYSGRFRESIAGLLCLPFTRGLESIYVEAPRRDVRMKKACLRCHLQKLSVRSFIKTFNVA